MLDSFDYVDRTWHSILDRTWRSVQIDHLGSILLLLLNRGLDSQVKIQQLHFEGPPREIMQKIMTDHGVLKPKLTELL